MAKVQMAEPDQAHGRGAAGAVELAAGQGAGSPSAAAGESPGPALAVQAERGGVDPARAGCTGQPTGGRGVIERPILFSGAMVRAILEGRKTQTRRVVKPQPDFVTNYHNPGRNRTPYVGGSVDPQLIRCPCGQPGDRLWVKETFKHTGNSWWGSEPDFVSASITYKEGGEFRRCGNYESFTKAPIEKWWNVSKAVWKPSIFMRREFSRITLEIVSVRVERVQEITDKDAEAEGAHPYPFMSTMLNVSTRKFDVIPNFHRRAYAELWDSINGKRKEGKPDYSWAANPWVWVVEFKPVAPAGQYGESVTAKEHLCPTGIEEGAR